MGDSATCAGGGGIAGTSTARSSHAAALEEHVTTTATPPAAAPSAAAAPQPQQTAVAPVRTRRPWGWTAGAIALILTGGVATAIVVTTSSRTEAVFVLAGAVDRGAAIAAADLTTLNVSEGQTGEGFTTDRLEEIVGQVAAVDLPAGSLVTPGALADSLGIERGQALVGLSLTSAQLPAQRPVAGQEIRIVPIASGTGLPGDGGEVASVPGTVSSVAVDEATGNVVVDVYVSETRAADLASRAAAGSVAVYLAPTEG